MAGPASVARARNRVLVRITAWRLPLGHEQRDAIELVASELVTNAAVHGVGPIRVGLRLDDSRLLLVVHDGSARPPVERAITDDEEAGRGLLLANHFADRTGWTPAPQGGKRVWAEFEVSSASPAPASLAAQCAQSGSREMPFHAISCASMSLVSGFPQPAPPVESRHSAALRKPGPSFHAPARLDRPYRRGVTAVIFTDRHYEEFEQCTRSVCASMSGTCCHP
ncbi:ATP-binding protein [Streptomyces xanthochromogenes]|uniref:ATP-binding protein n=1 Tax=Streptomyces xanthochromogenes TaxID=67384 RepID=UPI0037ADAA16